MNVLVLAMQCVCKLQLQLSISLDTDAGDAFLMGCRLLTFSSSCLRLQGVMLVMLFGQPVGWQPMELKAQ